MYAASVYRTIRHRERIIGRKAARMIESGELTPEDEEEWIHEKVYGWGFLTELVDQDLITRKYLWYAPYPPDLEEVD